MNKKRIWLVISTLILPYFVLFILATLFFSIEQPFFGYIMENIFRNNALNLLLALLIYCIVAISLSVVCFVVSIRKGWDALSLAKSALIIKLIQVPAYIAIFVLGLMFAITIFTFAFSIFFILIDCLTLALTGLLTVSSVINAVKNGTFRIKEVIWVIILQFVFCADVVASIIYYKKLRKRIKTENESV